MPVVEATTAPLESYGYLVNDPGACRIEIVRWPAPGTRLVDADTGDQGGTTEGVFTSEWDRDVLYGAERRGRWPLRARVRNGSRSGAHRPQETA